MLIIINIIGTFFTLRRSVEQHVIYESPQIIMIFQTFYTWIRFDSRLFKFLHNVFSFVIKSYRLVWRIMSFVFSCRTNTGSLLFLWKLSVFLHSRTVHADEHSRTIFVVFSQVLDSSLRMVPVWTGTCRSECYNCNFNYFIIRDFILLSASVGTIRKFLILSAFF
jgi:hypothetical protein